MILVDTNIFVYAINKSDERGDQAFRYLLGLRDSATPWFTTWSIAYEFFRVVTHPRIFENALKPVQALEFWEGITDSDQFFYLSEGREHLKFVRSSLEKNKELRGNLWHDAHIVNVMREHGIQTIATADTDFSKFSGLKIMNPLKVR